jgi:tetratricopeptide (TPR) repeat protein
MSSLPEFPSIPKQTILATLEDMREEFRKAQYKERTTWEYVRIVYMELGDKEKAAEAQAHFLEAEPTTVMDRWFYNANCQACETNNQVSYYIDIGEFDKAAELAEILFSGKETCANVPKVTYANLLLPLLRTGELEKAVELCKKGLAQVKNQRNFISSQTKILAFLALTDNLKLASQWFVAHAGFAEESYVPIEKLEYLRAAHLFWKAFADPKTRGWMPTLPLAHPLYQKTAQDYDPQILAEDARKRAMELSQAFDQRNGNTFFSEETERYWEIENYATPLKLPNRKI